MSTTTCHISLDNAGQVRAALNLIANDFAFKGNPMNPKLPESARAVIRSAVCRAAAKYGVESDLCRSPKSRTTIAAKMFLADLAWEQHVADAKSAKTAKVKRTTVDARSAVADMERFLKSTTSRKSTDVFANISMPGGRGEPHV